MKNRAYYSRIFLCLCLTVSILCSQLGVIVSASTISTKDREYYAVDTEELAATMPSIRNDSFWKSRMSVTAVEDGAQIRFNDAVRNMRAEAPGAYNLDGLHAVFSGLDGSANTQMAFMITQRKTFSDYKGTALDILAWIPAAVVLNTESGTITVYAAKAFHDKNNTEIITQIVQDDRLKLENLKEKEWSVRFRRDTLGTDDESDDEWIITIADVSARIKATLLIDRTSEMNYKEIYFALNAWRVEGNRFSIIWNTVHGGQSTCADDPASIPLLEKASSMIRDIDSIGAVTYDKGEMISNIRNTYDGFSDNMKTFIRNYETFVRKENAYAVVKKIGDLKTPSLDSKEAIETIDEEFRNLKADEKVEVSNYDVFISFKKAYLSLVVSEITNRPNIIEKEGVVKSGSDTQITNYVDVDGGTITEKITKTVKTTGRNGTQYLWIIFTATGILLAGITTAFLVAFFAGRRRRAE